MLPVWLLLTSLASLAVWLTVHSGGKIFLGTQDEVSPILLTERDEAFVNTLVSQQ